MKEQHKTRLANISILVSLAMVLAMLVLLVIILLRTQEIGRSNNSYLQAMVCLGSKSPRSLEYIKQCYDNAEQANGNTIRRFGDAVENGE